MLAFNRVRPLGAKHRVMLYFDRLHRIEFGLMLRYVFIGCTTNGLSLAIYYFATLQLQLSPTFSLAFASSICFFMSYLANRRWSFRDQGTHAAAFRRYCVAYVGIFFIQWSVLIIGTEFLSFSHVWVVLVGMLVGALSFYLLQRYWVFHLPRSTEPSAARRLRADDCKLEQTR